MTQISEGTVPTAPPGERVPFDPAESGEAPGTAGDKAVTGFSHAILIIWSIMVIVPLIWVLMSSFKTSSCPPPRATSGLTRRRVRPRFGVCMRPAT